jgi:CheY-like chemotaxis protein
VADAIEGAVLSIRPQADAKHVALETAIDGDVGLIAADAERLQQIVWNLLANAIKFTPAGGHVHVSAERDGGRVFIRVIDDGQGIDREFLPHLFEPFRQADSSVTRRHGGLGLGLSICRQLVQAHGGTITAHSDGDGHGASFTIDLPVGDVAALQAPPARPSWRSAGPPAPPSEPASARRLEGVHLLLVDDDEDSRDLIACILEERGAEVAQASSAAEAMTLLEQEPPPDVVLSDIGMPDVSGYMLIRKIRELPSERGGRVPAVALTAYARTVDSERALEAGFQAHVTKPVDADRLTSVVAGLARGSGVEVGH